MLATERGLLVVSYTRETVADACCNGLTQRSYAALQTLGRLELRNRFYAIWGEILNVDTRATFAKVYTA